MGYIVNFIVSSLISLVLILANLIAIIWTFKIKWHLPSVQIDYYIIPIGYGKFGVDYETFIHFLWNIPYLTEEEKEIKRGLINEVNKQNGRL